MIVVGSRISVTIGNASTLAEQYRNRDRLRIDPETCVTNRYEVLS